MKRSPFEATEKEKQEVLDLLGQIVPDTCPFCGREYCHLNPCQTARGFIWQKFERREQG